MTSTRVARCINEALQELFGVIFEEHAKLEWRAPVIDGQVCRRWRQTILRSPRAWSHLKIVRNFALGSSKLPQWLDRSGSVPLHVQLMEWVQGAEKVLDPHCKRIKSMESPGYFFSLLKNRSFPILQSLTIRAKYSADYWDPPLYHWSASCTMPELRSFRASDISVDALPPNIFPALRALALYRVDERDYIIPSTSHSLTSLMLDRVSLKYTSGSLEFPSLRFLSLFEVKNIKHRMNVPALTTYHESGQTEQESFSMSLPSLIEYGTRRIYGGPVLSVTKLYRYYPNISRLSVRAFPSDVKRLLHSLSRQPTALPMLRILAVGTLSNSIKYTGEDKSRMMNDVIARNIASSVEMELCFDGKVRVPLYFARVRVYIDEGRSQLTSTSEPGCSRALLRAFYLSSVCGCFVDVIDKGINDTSSPAYVIDK